MTQYCGLGVLDHTLDDPRLAEGGVWNLGAPQGAFIDGRGNPERFGARLGVRSTPSTPNAPHTRWFRLPAGPYTFGEFRSGSEIDPGNPGYVPIAVQAQRQTPVRVDDRGSGAFDERTAPFGRSNDLSDGWVLDRP